MDKNTKYYSQIRRPPKKREGPFPESAVETYGAISAQEQIMKYINAGVQLQVQRIGFDFEGDGDVPDDWADITRSPGFDMFDVTRILGELREKRKYLPPGAKGITEENAEGKKEDEVKKGGDEPPGKNGKEAVPEGQAKKEVTSVT